MYCYNKTCLGFSPADNGNCYIMNEQNILACPGRTAFKQMIKILKAWEVDTERLMELVERDTVGMKGKV